MVVDDPLPKRRHRSTPRVVKRKMSTWRLTQPFCEAVAFLGMGLRLRGVSRLVDTPDAHAS